MPKLTKSSQDWLKRQAKDPYVQKAKKSGYRSRSAFKLLEMQEKHHFIKPGFTVVDLGAAPGGWSQVLVNQVGRKGSVIAMDILPMEPIPRVEFLQGDFGEEEIFDQLLTILKDKSVDLVVCDIAPNLSGNKTIDQPRIMFLLELVLEFAHQVLKPGGHFLIKIFHGTGFDDFLKDIRATFKTVKVCKPEASRKESKEVYLLGIGFTGKIDTLEINL